MNNELNKLHNDYKELQKKYNKLLIDYEKLKNSKVISFGCIIDIIQRFKYSNQNINDIANYYNVSSDFIISILINNNIINNFNNLSINDKELTYISDDDLTYTSDDDLTYTSNNDLTYIRDNHDLKISSSESDKMEI
jgi:hypothetical protein